MRVLRYFAAELGRLLRDPMSWAAAMVVMLSPLMGLVWYRPLTSLSQMGYATTMQGMYVANPALAGSVAASISFGLLTIRNQNRIRASRVETLTDAAVSPTTTAAVQTAAMLCLSMLAQVITVVAWLPWTARTLGAIFSLGSYLQMYLILMYGGVPLAILAASAVIQLTERADVTLLVFAAFVAASLVIWVDNWQLCWLNPAVWAVSDDFSNERILRSVAYMRLAWLCGLSGLWMLSWLAVRRHGQGLIASFLGNAKRAWRPVVAMSLVTCACILYVRQPFVDHSAPEMDYSFLEPEEYLEDVTCSARHVDVRPDPDTGSVHGKAEFSMRNSSGEEREIRFLINPGYDVTAVRANGDTVPFEFEDSEAMNERRFAVSLPAGPQVELSIEYGGYPQEWNLSADMQGRAEISSEYMNIENDALAPAPYDVWFQGDTLPATMDITLPSHMRPLLFGDGTTTALRENADGTTTWRMEDDGYHMILYAGDYVHEEIPAGEEGQIDFYYGRRHEPIMRELDAANLVREAASYCNEHIGPLYFGNNGRLALIESRCSGGGYAASGASLMDELDFTAQNLSSGVKGTPAQTMIHELVHQWWGLGNMFDPMDTEEGWSAEGLTCYTTYRIAKELYGDEAARRDFVDVWQADSDSYHRNFFVRNPQYLASLPETYRARIEDSLTTVQQYSEMPLKILRAQELVGGEEAMDAILSDLFGRELDPEYPYLSYQEFLDACDLTKEDLNLEQNIYV